MCRSALGLAWPAVSVCSRFTAKSYVLCLMSTKPPRYPIPTPKCACANFGKTKHEHDNPMSMFKLAVRRCASENHAICTYRAPFSSHLTASIHRTRLPIMQAFASLLNKLKAAKQKASASTQKTPPTDPRYSRHHRQVCGDSFISYRDSAAPGAQRDYPSGDLYPALGSPM